LIGFDIVNEARARKIKESDLSPASPLIMAVDIAREGDDFSAIVFRKGQKMYPFRRYQKRNLMHNASLLSSQINKMRPDIVFVDATGMGSGVLDRLIQLGHDQIVGVHFGAKPEDTKVYVNRRVEIWCRMADWLRNADIPDSQRMNDELCSPEYWFEKRSEKMVLESKKEMKARGLDSPDVADAMAMTFTHIVPTRMLSAETATEPEVW